MGFCSYTMPYACWTDTWPGVFGIQVLLCTSLHHFEAWESWIFDPLQAPWHHQGTQVGRSVLEEGEGSAKSNNAWINNLSVEDLPCSIKKSSKSSSLECPGRIYLFTLSWMVIQNPGDFSQDVSGLLTKALNPRDGRSIFLEDLQMVSWYLDVSWCILRQRQHQVGHWG